MDVRGSETAQIEVQVTQDQPLPTPEPVTTPEAEASEETPQTESLLNGPMMGNIFKLIFAIVDSRLSKANPKLAGVWELSELEAESLGETGAKAFGPLLERFFASNSPLAVFAMALLVVTLPRGYQTMEALKKAKEETVKRERIPQERDILPGREKTVDEKLAQSIMGGGKKE